MVQRYLRALEQTNRHDWRDGRSQAFLKDVRRYVEQTQRHTALLRSPEYAANFDTPPQLIDFPLIYPEIGGAELSGVCTASLGVTETGQAVDVITLCQYSGEGERGWSRRGVAEGWTFKPATKNGEAVYFGDIEYSFRIGPYLDLK